ncbi:MAG TPA: hypothetical protein VEY95_06370 [Azospirillaceae bacterium]|nr:hypothetical protein [Azospirillaceae bacterium]
MDAEWARCGRWLAAALAHAGDTHTLDDVRAQVERGEAQFWPGRTAVLVTELVDYPRLKACRVWLGGGELEEIKEMVRSVAVWAKAQGCARLEVLGRPGWVRAIGGRRLAAYSIMEV